MADEQVTVESTLPAIAPAESSPTPDPGATAAPGTGIQPEGDSQTDQPERVFTQAELDEILGQRLARERRKIEREVQQRFAQPQAPTGDITREQFESDEAYVDAIASRKATALVAQRDAEREQNEASEAYETRQEAARSKYADFEAVARNPSLPVTNEMAAVIIRSEVGPEILYHLGTHPDEAARIARLSPFLQAKEIGRLEGKMIAEPPARKVSSAPAPIVPVRSPGNKTPVVDTTDPRSIESLSMDKWAEAEMARVRKAAEARVH